MNDKKFSLYVVNGNYAQAVVKADSVKSALNAVRDVPGLNDYKHVVSAKKFVFKPGVQVVNYHCS